MPRPAPDPEKVYQLSQVPKPAAPGPVVPPGSPYEFKVYLNADGSIRLTFKCKNPPGASGTAYTVRRRPLTGTAQQFVYVGATGRKEFVDR
ncbi:MAG: hypothetical protein K2X97_20930, partial [Mycobacteriaceae bacterium]|nr:hypothetical protein [Mycobacteriaceae bacterium]